jgi:signal transduction histidine kinase
MFGAILQAAATVLLGSTLAVYVALRPERSPVRNPLLGVLASLVFWSIGVIWRLTAPDDGSAFAGFLFGWAGIAALPPLWLLLASRYARVPILEQRPLLALAAFVPSLFAWIALASNDLHHLFYREFTRTSTERGPLFYAWLLCAYPSILGGLFLFLRAARTGPSRGARSRLVAVSALALLPTATSLLFIAGLLPVAYDPTPAALSISVVVLTLGIFRMQLFDTLPLARRDIVAHLRDGVLIADAEGVVIDANPAALDILMRPEDDVRGRTLRALLGSASRDARIAEEIDDAVAALAADDSLEPTELRTIADRRLEITARCLHAGDGNPVGRLLVLRDRTEERKYEHLLRQAQRLETVGSLAAGVAHEVNNPLAFVRANLHQIERLAALVCKCGEGLAETDSEQQEIAELPQIVSECLDGIDRIGRIVGAMRRFSRLPAEDFDAVDLNEVLREAIRLAELHRNRGVTVEAWLSEGLPAVQGSSQRLTQVFLNLLVNAKQALATHQDGHITVRTRLARDIVEVVVMDDGPGVPADIRDRIFDPFFTTKSPDDGTGLGLSIAFDIVREHGGVLELKPGPCGGACFIAYLPSHADADALAASAAAGG